MKLLEKVRNLDVGWYGAAAGAAAAGAALFPQSRIGAGLVGGLVVLAIGVWRTPCCASCAGRPAAAEPASSSSSSTSASSAPAVDFARLVNGAGATSVGFGSTATRSCAS